DSVVERDDYHQRPSWQQGRNRRRDKICNCQSSTRQQNSLGVARLSIPKHPLGRPARLVADDITVDSYRSARAGGRVFYLRLSTTPAPSTAAHQELRQPGADIKKLFS